MDVADSLISQSQAIVIFSREQRNEAYYCLISSYKSNSGPAKSAA